MGDRPWSPGPWLIEGRTIYKLHPNPQPSKNMPQEVNKWFAGFQLMNCGASVKEVEACALLASKAPEMAEILIRLVKAENNMGEWMDISSDARLLLKEVGYGL